MTSICATATIGWGRKEAHHRQMGEEGGPPSPLSDEGGREEACLYAIKGRREPARTAARGRPRSAPPSSKGGGQPPSLGPCATSDLSHWPRPDTPLRLCLLEEATAPAAAQPQPRATRYPQPLDRHRYLLSPLLDHLRALCGVITERGPE
jgi:hypothetical protein